MTFQKLSKVKILSIFNLASEGFVCTANGLFILKSYTLDEISKKKYFDFGGFEVLF